MVFKTLIYLNNVWMDSFSSLKSCSVAAFCRVLTSVLPLLSEEM